MNDTLIHACEMFLLPTTISFIAFGIAPTQKLKTLTSVLGALTSAVWVVDIIFWTGILTAIDFITTVVLSVIFLITWIIVAYPLARAGTFRLELSSTRSLVIDCDQVPVTWR